MITDKRLMELAHGAGVPTTEDELEAVDIAREIDPAAWKLHHKWRRFQTMKAAVRLIERGRNRPTFNFTVNVVPRRTLFSFFRRAA